MVCTAHPSMRMKNVRWIWQDAEKACQQRSRGTERLNVLQEYASPLVSSRQSLTKSSLSFAKRLRRCTKEALCLDIILDARERTQVLTFLAHVASRRARVVNAALAVVGPR